MNSYLIECGICRTSTEPFLGHLRMEEVFTENLKYRHTEAEMMAKKKTSIDIDPEVWGEAKKLAIDEGTTVGLLVENLLRKRINERGKRSG